MVSDLLRQARAGSEEALDELFRRCAGKLHALIRVRMGSLRNRLESRDVLQNTFLKAFRNLDQFAGDDDGSLMAWMAVIARNELRDLADRHGAQRRRVDRETALPESDRLLASVGSLVSRMARNQRSERLEEALLELSDAKREVVLLRSFEELEYREIGERMNRSADACRMLYARALTELTLEMNRQ